MRMRDLSCLESIATTSIFTVYFLPSFIAFSRVHNDRFAIFLINLFLGWTILGCDRRYNGRGILERKNKL